MSPGCFTTAKTALLVGGAVLLSACGSIGDTEDVKKAYELAIECKTDQALAAVDRARQGGGLSSYMADLQRVVILQDAGRTAEAKAALAERNKQAGANASDAAEAEQTVTNSVDDLRSEREKQSGSRTCS